MVYMLIEYNMVFYQRYDCDLSDKNDMKTTLKKFRIFLKFSNTMPNT